MRESGRLTSTMRTFCEEKRDKRRLLEDTHNDQEVGKATNILYMCVYVRVMYFQVLFIKDVTEGFTHTTRVNNSWTVAVSSLLALISREYTQLV